MKSYELAEPVHHEGDFLGERFEVDFPAGKVTPKAERDEHVLEHLVSVGLATPVKPKSKTTSED